MPLPDIPTDLWRSFQQTIFGEKADSIQNAESFRWSANDALDQLPPSDGDPEAELKRLQEEQQRRQEEQQRQIAEQAQKDQEDYQRIADERAVADRANQLAAAAPPGVSTYNDPTAGGTLSQPLPPQVQPPTEYGAAGDTPPPPVLPPSAPPPSFADTANGLITSTFGPEQSPPIPEPLPPPAPEPPKPLSFADTANSLITNTFGPESTAAGEPGPWEQAARGVTRAAEGIKRAGTGLYEAVKEPSNVTDTLTSAGQAAVGAALETAAPTDPQQIAVNMGKPGMMRGIEIIQAADNAFGTEVGRRVGRAMGLTNDELVSVLGRSISGEDIAGAVGSAALDPTNYIGAGEAPALARAARPTVQASIEAAGTALRRGGAALGREAAGQLMDLTPVLRAVPPGEGGDAIAAIKSLRAAGMEEAAASAERELAMKTPQTLEDIQRQTGMPSAITTEGGNVVPVEVRYARRPGVQPTEPSLPNEIPNPSPLTAEEQALNAAADTRARAAPPHAGYLEDPTFTGQDVPETAGPQSGDRIRLPDGTRARVEEPPLTAGGGGGRLPPPTPPPAPTVGDRIRLPDGTRATVEEPPRLTAGGGSGAPPAPPPASAGGGGGVLPPPPPPGGRQFPLPGIPEPPPEDLTHVRGFGILQGVDPVGREALVQAAAKGRQFPRGVPRADPTEAAVRLGMTPDEVAAKWLRQDTRQAADEVAVLRQGVAASLDDVQAAAQKARDGTLTADDAMTAVDGIVNAAVGGEFLRGGRRAAESAGRALSQFRQVVSVQSARRIYDAMDSAAQAAKRSRVVLEGLKNGKVPNESGLRQLEQTAATLEGAAGRDLLGEGGEAVRRRARRNAGVPEPPTSAPGEAATGTPGAPREPSFAERWGQLKRAHTLAEEAGDTARTADIAHQIDALKEEVRAEAVDRARQAVMAEKKPLTLEEAQRIVDERLGQGPVSRIMREELAAAKGHDVGQLQASLDKDVQRKVLAALKKAEAEQEALGKSINIQTQRGIEKAMAAEQRANVKTQARVMANEARQWMDRAKRDPSNMAFRTEFDQKLREMADHSNVGEVMAADLREQFATHLDEHAFQFMSDLEKRNADAERAAIAGERAGIQKEALQGMAQRLRDTVKAIHDNPNHPGLSEEVDRLMSDMNDVSIRGFEMSSDIKQSLTKAGLERFAGKLSGDRVDQFMGMLRNIDPNDPRALGNIMAYMRRGHSLDRLREFSVANMLSSTATSSPMGVNNIANTLSTAAHYGFKLPGMAATEAIRTAGGRRGTPELTFGDVGAAYKAALGAFGPAVADANAIMRHGSTLRQGERAAQLADFGGSHPELMAERRAPVADVIKGRWGPVGELLHMLSTRQLEASDTFWSQILESGNYAGLAARKARMSGGKLTAEQILANPLDHMDVLDRATAMSRYTLLKQRSHGSRVAGGLITAPPDASLQKRLAAFGMQQIIPFTTTPLNSVLQLMEYSPVGAAVQGIRAARTADGFARAELTNKALAGATLAAIGTMGVQAPIPNAPGPEWTWITGAVPLDTEKRKALQAQGWQDNSIWNPVTRQYNSIMGTPMAPVLFPAWALQGFADAVEKGERKGTSEEWDSWLAQALGGVALRTANSVIEQSFLRSVGDIVSGFSLQGDPSRLLSGWVSRFIPAGSLVAQLARLGDAAQRDPTSITERVQERTPIRGMLPVRQGPLGETLPADMQGITGFLLPSPRRTNERSNPTYQAFEQAGVDVGAPRTQLSLEPGLSIQLTPDEQRRWQTLRGDTLQKIAPNMQQKPWWNKPSAREEAMKTILSDAGEVADARLVKEIGGDEIRRRAREEAAKLRARARAS